MTKTPRLRAVLLAVLGAALLALAIPALAAAETYVVNLKSIGPGCSPGSCTLPGAIAAANGNPGKDTIEFEAGAFGGAAPQSTIPLSSALPAITDEVSILGGHCPTSWFGQGAAQVQGPCVEVTLNATASTSIFTVNASNVTIEGIAIEGAGNGILVGQGRQNFAASNDWFGAGLNSGTGSANAAAGIRLEPGADGATIGGPDPVERNVFTAGNIGLYVDGASSSTTEGNYFGLSPDGTFPFGHTLDVGVRIVDDTRSTPVVKAVDNEVGGVLLGPEAASPACDGPCNVFAVEEEGADIDLAGFVGEHVAAASGPTGIRSNYLGLSPDGSAEIGRAEDAIYAGTAAGPSEVGPGEVIIGGTDSLAERNFIIGGEYGVFAERAELLGVIGNVFGYLFDGSSADSPAVAGIRASSEVVAAGAFIAGNKMNAENSVGIESLFKGSQISGNEIVGAQFGILTKEDDGGVGNLIEGNSLVENGALESGAATLVENDANTIVANSVSKSGGIGIEVEGEDFSHQIDSNRVVGNTVAEAGAIGILVGSNANHSQIGGDAAGEANTILGSGLAMATPEEKERFGAITINGRQTGRNEIATNTGAGNFGAFIKLISHGGAEEPNGGIQPPAIATALQSSASGTAEPGAIVRVFNKASAEPGELGALLAVVTADPGGAWKATFAKQPAGTLIAATESAEVDKPGEVPAPTGRGTSEVSAPLAAVAEAEKEQGGGGTTGTPGGNPVPIAAPAPTPAKAPTVKITTGPKKSSTATTAKFKFKAEPAAGAKFECKLDNSKWAKCTSPKTYKKLKVGKHTFRVRASASGLTGAAVKYQFTVKA
jgi:hypothetical protein